LVTVHGSRVWDLNACQVSIGDYSGLVDFSIIARELTVRLNKIKRKQGVSASIEMLDAFRYGKLNKPLTRSATEQSTSPAESISD